MRIFSQSLIIIACFAACAAHATDAAILAVGTSCSDGNIRGVWTEISNESTAYEWYVTRGRIKQCHTDGPVDCYCRPNGDTVGADCTSEIQNAGSAKYHDTSASRVSDGVACGEVGVSCQCVPESCNGNRLPYQNRCVNLSDIPPIGDEGCDAPGGWGEDGYWAKTTNASSGDICYDSASGTIVPCECLPINNGGESDALRVGDICTDIKNAHLTAMAVYQQNPHGSKVCEDNGEQVPCKCTATDCRGDATTLAERFNGICYPAGANINYDCSEEQKQERRASAAIYVQTPYGQEVCYNGDDYVLCACIAVACLNPQDKIDGYGYCRPTLQTGSTDVVISDAPGEESVDVRDGPEQDSDDAETECEEGLVRFSGIVRDGVTELGIAGVGLEIMLDGKVKRLTVTEGPGDDYDNYGKFDECVPQNTEVQFVFYRYRTETVQVGAEDMLDQNITMTYNGDIQLSTGSGTDTESISDLAKTLDEIEDAYGLSKWRTVDGKFNYARLASDATAAVVLGTTGALVTSSVVKKKQVEAGFESLECTVGGQHVGDWGDVFRIDGK